MGKYVCHIELERGVVLPGTLVLTAERANTTVELSRPVSQQQNKRGQQQNDEVNSRMHEPTQP